MPDTHVRHQANLPRLALHVPEPRFRPGDPVDFSNIAVPPAGETRRPGEDSAPSAMHDLAFGLVRVLDDVGQAVGPWNPQLTAEKLRASFRRITPQEAASLKPLRVRVITVGPGDTIGTLSARMMGTDRKLELFRLINALGPTSAVAPGAKVKIISE